MECLHSRLGQSRRAPGGAAGLPSFSNSRGLEFTRVRISLLRIALQGIISGTGNLAGLRNIQKWGTGFSACGERRQSVN